MLQIIEQVQQDLKTAMRSKDQLSLSVLRMLLSALRNKKIELYGNNEQELNDKEVSAVIKSEFKKRKDSIASYEAGDRTDLAEAEKKELPILEKYMPSQMPEDEIRTIANALIAEKGKDLKYGVLMGQLMSRLKGQADGALAGKILKELLQ